jgi:hypothetical protein
MPDLQSVGIARGAADPPSKRDALAGGSSSPLLDVKSNRAFGATLSTGASRAGSCRAERRVPPMRAAFCLPPHRVNPPTFEYRRDSPTRFAPSLPASPRWLRRANRA